MFPVWLHVLAIVALVLGALSFLYVLMDVIRHPQHMGVMNIVWPVTALAGSVPLIWLYGRYAPLASTEAMHRAKERGDEMPSKTKTPFPIMVAKGALHCGSGCMLGDIAAEWLAFLVPGVALALGWHWAFNEKTFAVWVLDYLFAYALGILFQYYAIVPMRGLKPAEGIVAAIKADTLSLTAWQVGMYGFMAFAQFFFFSHVLGHKAPVDSPEFWFAMQLAMISGFGTAYPVNWWLVSSGIKEKM